MAETKPACDLIFDYTYPASAAQTTTMTVLGQLESASGVTPDEVIQVNVTAEQLNGLLTVGAQSAPGHGYPEVTLKMAGVAEKLNTAYDSFVLVDDASSGVQFTDGNGDQVDTLQKVFSGRNFTFSTESPLASIPIEAVKAIDFSGAISVKNEAADSVGDTKLVAGPGPAEGLLRKEVIATTDAMLAGPEAAVRSLYLQALAADRYQQATAPAGPNDPTSQSSSPGWNFQENDTLTIYTNLSLTKTRKFIPDPDSYVGGTPGDKKFAIDGCDVVIGDVNTADDQYDSSPLSHIVAWKLKVVTPPL
jgi:hypothetical protein